MGYQLPMYAGTDDNVLRENINIMKTYPAPLLDFTKGVGLEESLVTILQDEINT
jgi:hypothetical protein